MYKVAILGSENSHADTFLEFVIREKRVTDVEIVGVYSDEEDAIKKQQEKYGVYAASSYDEFVGKIDGLIITARHGDNHYKYAKPYISSGIPMFIDKPITINEQEAVVFMEELKRNKVRVSGGSMCIHAPFVQELKRAVKDKTYGEVLSGYFRAPLKCDETYGGFFFYAQHMVQVMCEIFGYEVKSVHAINQGNVCTCVFHYDAFHVVGSFVERNGLYYAGISCEKDFVGSVYKLEKCAEKEFDTYYQILTGGKQEQSYDLFIAPVFILNAIYRSIKSGNEERVNAIEQFK